MKGLLVAFIIASVSLISGCATIISGENQTVTIQTIPEGAEVVINGAVKGITPITFPLKREDGSVLELRKEGYKSHVGVLHTELNGMFWGNILFGGLLGSTTDASTGASREYMPGTIVVNLEKN